MSDVNLLEAFASYKIKSSTRARSALTAERALVISCFYVRFSRADEGVLKYEEDLTGDTGSTATLLRTHLADALNNELDVRAIIAMPAVKQPAALRTDPPPAGRAPKMSFHARKDLVGKVTAFDGSRFTIEFRKAQAAA